MGRYHTYQWIVGTSRDVAFNDPCGNQICMFVLWIECLTDIICWCFLFLLRFFLLKCQFWQEQWLSCFNNYKSEVLFCFVWCHWHRKASAVLFLFPSWRCLDAADCQYSLWTMAVKSNNIKLELRIFNGILKS